MRIINVTPEYQYIFDNGKIVKEEVNKEKGIVTSFVHPHNLFSITKKFDKGLSEETVFLEMEKYVFSYPGIDINKEYKNIYLKIERENSLIIEALLADTEVLNKEFSRILNHYKYIDFISPSFLAWEEYYKLTKIEPKNDIFVYLNEEDSFLSAYSEGKYLFHKTLNKLQTLQKDLNKNMDEIIEILKTKGLDISAYENPGEYNSVEKFFSEFFLRVFNVINFSLNEYQIPKFDRIIFYSPFEIKNVFENYENYWSMNNIEFKKSVVSTEYDHLEYLITVYNAANYNNESVNLTIFSKPPAFFKTKAGRFFLFLLFFVLVILGYVGYENFIIIKTKEEIKHLEKKYAVLEKKHSFYIKLTDKYKKENKKLEKDLKDINIKTQKIVNKLNILYEKGKSPLFYNILAKISKSMKKYSLKAKSINKQKNHITLIIVSNYDNTQEVTSFMDDLIRYKYKNIKVTYISNTKNKYISKVDFDYE